MGYTHVTAAWPTTHQTMTTDTPSIPVGIDGEAAELITPLEFTIRPGALRVLQPMRTSQPNGSSPCDGDVTEPLDVRQAQPGCPPMCAGRARWSAEHRWY
jgi:hypothetical protein